MVMDRILKLFLSIFFVVSLVLLSPFGMKTAKAESVRYDVTGGQLNFDITTGTITGYRGDPTEIVVPSQINNVSVTRIDDHSFSECISLTSITLPDSVTSIGDLAFNGCSSLNNIMIPDSVTSIGDHAFYGCSSLASITLSNSLTSISRSAFYNCSSLNNITLPDSVMSIGDYAFYGCSNLTNIEIPHNVTSIGTATFYECSSLASITLPDSVTSIGENTFQGCTSLASITIPNSVTNIGTWAFYKCSSLSSITLPNGMTSIGNNTFQECSSLISVTLPNSVTSIGDSAFHGCSSLTNITIPNSMTSIGYGVFNGCSSLNSFTLPNSVTSIGDFAFYESSSLTNITLSNSLTSIGRQAFNKCISLSDVEIPSSVTNIGSYAFSGCSNLSAAYFYGDAPSMGSSVFKNAKTGFKIYYLTGNTSFTNPWYDYPTSPFGESITPLTITTVSLVSAFVSSEYNATITVSGGTAPFTWGATGLPTGLTIDATTGIISGTPTIEGTFPINILVTDSKDQSSSKSLSLTVNVITNEDSVPPELQSSSLDDSNKIITLVFNEGIDNNLGSLQKLKETVTFAPDGVNFAALGANDEVTTNGNNLVISFGTALTGDTNKIKVAANAIRDRAGNVLDSELVIENISTGKIDECFIATAAYGSKLQPDVVLLRQFRDRFLETNPLGEAFVKFYYRNSPPVAHFIANNYELKIVVRALLAPLVIVAYLLLHPLIMSTFLALVILMTIWRMRRMRGGDLRKIEIKN